MPIGNNPDLIALEQQGWEALSSSPEDAKAFYGAVLADDARMLFPGNMQLVGKAQILDMMGGPPWQSFELSETAMTVLSNTYRVIAQRAGSQPYRALVCSTYAWRASGWQLIIHQQTPA